MSRLGSALLRFESVTSTNDVARALAAEDAPEGTAVLAQEQTAGRGRQGRTWVSSPGDGLYLSVILRPVIHPARAGVITLAAAVAVAETLAVDFEIAADIKWPNDVLASGRKISGMLVESATEGSQLQYAVVGIGVNLNHRRFPEEIRQTATSVFLECGRVVQADAFAARLLERFDAVYRQAMDEPRLTLQRWESRSTYAHGRAVRISSPDGYADGITRGLTDSGALILELANGARREFASGEVSLRPAAD
jgi:BirA family biotin operon repressor/biotin-[acetyl-CoA-carboxylase] ligase